MTDAQLETIDEATVRAFERDGVVCLRNMIDRRWLEPLAAGVDRIVESPTALHTVQTLKDEPGFFLSDICMAQTEPAIQDFVLNGPAAAIAARLMRTTRCNFWADTLWVKAARTPKRTRWHQDQPFFWVDGEQLCVIWWPLDPVSREDGLELVKGSHRWGRWFAPELSKRGQDLYAGGGRVFERMPDIEAERAGYDIGSWAVDPGDCIVFHGSTVHGAAGNGAGSVRRALSTIWMGDDTRYAERPSPGRPHFHGHDLAPGDPMDSGYFPRAWPRASSAPLAARDYPRFTDPALKITN